jgi:hypothetical protein
MADTTTSSATTMTTAATTTTTAAATTTTLVNPNRLAGTWVAPNHNVYITFDGQGTHFVSYLNGEPFDFGPYHLDGNVLTMVSGEGQEVCPDGSTGTYEIAIPASPKELRAQLVSDSCSERTRAMISAPLRWWSPLP